MSQDDDDDDLGGATTLMPSRIEATPRRSAATPVATLQQPPRPNAPPAAAPSKQREPTTGIRLTRTSVVPEFRTDLQLNRTDGGYIVVDPATGQTHKLNEYEVSLARLLNGRRPVFEVLESVERLGIPANLDSVQKFVTRLERLNFLRPPQTLDDAIEQAVTTWPTRGEWDAGVRTLFQSGVRFLRQGKFDEAIGYFEALLVEDPTNEEAKELLALARQPPPARPSGAMAAVVAPAAPGPVMEQPAPAVIASPVPAVPNRRTSMLVLVSVLSVCIAAGVFYAVTRSPAGTRSERVAVIQEPASAIPDAAVVVDASTTVVVDASAQVAVESTPSDAGANDSMPVDAGVAVAVAPPDAGVPQVRRPGPGPTVRGVQAVAVDAPVAGTLKAFLTAPRKVKAGEKLFEIVVQDEGPDPAKLSAVQKKVAELTTLAQQDPVYEPFLADAKAELAKLSAKRGGNTTVVTARRAGVATPSARNGETVTKGQVLAEIK